MYEVYDNNVAHVLHNYKHSRSTTDTVLLLKDRSYKRKMALK